MDNPKIKELNKLAFPVFCESHDLEGNWILVNLVEYRGNGKWLAFDEDGEYITVDSATLKKPHMLEHDGMPPL